jgi:hypothetical protein
MGGGARVAGKAADPWAAGREEGARPVKLFAQQKQARQWHDSGPMLAAKELAAKHGLKAGMRRCEMAGGRIVESPASAADTSLAATTSAPGESCCNGTLAPMAGRTREAVVSVRCCQLAGGGALRRSRFHEENLRVLSSYLEAYGQTLAVETPSRAMLRIYNKRVMAEPWIKEGEQAVKMTRLCCDRFRSNHVRLGLSLVA